VPNPIRWPEGCRFRARCSKAFEPCGEPPPLFDLGAVGRSSRCWLVNEASFVDASAPR
jgi:ABC-type dipeptide/oligopeptide/nickel transport system ATPase component